MGKRPRKTFPKTEWEQYERDFFNYCRERDWTVEPDEDGCPTLFPARKAQRGQYKVCPWGTGVVALMITPDAAISKTKYVNKFKRTGVSHKIEWDGDFDAIILFGYERFPRIVKTFNLKRKKLHKGPPPEAIAKAQEVLRKKREAAQNSEN